MELIQPSEVVELVHKDGNWKLDRETGFSPVQLVAASAAACTIYTFEHLLEQKRMSCRVHRVLFDYVEDSYYPNPIVQIDILVYLQTVGQDREAIRTTFLEIPQNCPVLQALHPRIRVNESIIFVD
ncbi:MAG: OsmC family protein [Sporolactobacillus sp.]